MSALRIFSSPPSGLLDCGARDLAGLLGGPALVRFAGGSGRAPLAVVALLHGNETSGWSAVARFLKKHRGSLPRPLLLLLANVRAAEAGVRFLPDGADWNRVWGGDDSGGAEMGFARAALDEFRRAKIWAGLDLHNNTGRNPLYAAVFRNRRCGASARLAAGFSGVVVETEMPRGTCMEALSGVAPAATLECGVSGSAGGIARAADFLGEVLRREDLPREAPGRVLRTIAKVRLSGRHSVAFGGALSGADVSFPAGVERWNFKELREGFVFARLRTGGGRFAVLDAKGADVFERYFALDEGRIRAARRFVPAMLTANEKAARDDCLCYVMEEG